MRAGARVHVCPLFACMFVCMCVCKQNATFRVYIYTYRHVCVECSLMCVYVSV